MSYGAGLCIPATEIRDRPIPLAKTCECGAQVRLLLERGQLVLADETEVPGGELLVNVNHVIGRLTHEGAKAARREGHLGFRTHVCTKGVTSWPAS